MTRQAEEESGSEDSAALSGDLGRPSPPGIGISRATWDVGGRCWENFFGGFFGGNIWEMDYHGHIKREYMGKCPLLVSGQQDLL